MNTDYERLKERYERVVEKRDRIFADMLMSRDWELLFELADIQEEVRSILTTMKSMKP